MELRVFFKMMSFGKEYDEVNVMKSYLDQL